MAELTDQKTRAPASGGRTELDQLPLPEAPQHQSPWQRWYRNVSLFVAGMYTGVKCYGVPQDHPGADADRDRGPL